MPEALPRGTIQAPPLGYEEAMALSGECFLWRCRQGLESVIPSRWARLGEEADAYWGMIDSLLFLIGAFEEFSEELERRGWKQDTERRFSLSWPLPPLAYRCPGAFSP